MEEQNKEKQDFSGQGSGNSNQPGQQADLGNIFDSGSKLPDSVGLENGQNLAKFSQKSEKSDDQNQTKAAPESPVANTQEKDKKSSGGAIWIFIVIVLAIVGIWYLNSREDNNPQGPNQEQDNVNINVDDSEEDGKVSIFSEEEWENQQDTEGDSAGIVVKTEKGTIISAFYNNIQKDPGLPDCSKVYPLEREISSQYASDAVAAAIGLVNPLSDEEKAAGWTSGIPVGTYMTELKISDDGTARVYLSGEIAKIAGSCAVISVRSQVEKTLSQFSYIKKVEICVNGNCNQDEILQP